MRLRLVTALCLASALSQCAPSSARSAGIYTVAIDGAPGGALLSAWVEPGTEHRGWIVGGLLGVEPSSVTDGRVGRVLRYENGALSTVCTTDRVLWWVHGVRDGARTIVYAAGEGGRVLRIVDGRCETLAMDAVYAEGAPTFWGLWASSADEVWLVGGSVDRGPRGVLVRYDGARFNREEALLPSEARARNLYKIARGALGTFIVGEGGTLLSLRGDRASSAYEAVSTDWRASDNRLFTVSCDALTPVCFAVGGAGAGVVLRGDATGWRAIDGLGELPGLAGVFAQDANSAFIVGAYGFTLHTNTVSFYRPDTATVRAALHGVGGNASLVIAVGGELDNPTLDQRATILVRGESVRTFTLDGRAYVASGAERPTLGSGVSGRQ